MKSWMGGRRRRIAVARRDPMVLQRQFFARNREQNHQNARRAHARQTIDSFRRPERAPDNRGRAPQGPPLVSTDVLVLANPSAIDAVAGELRHPKRQRLEEPRRRREDVDSVRREPAPEPARELELDVSNDIRIFHADVEKTHQFRRRTLPDGFLNSQLTDDRRSKRRVREHSRKATLGTRNWLDGDSGIEEARIVRRRRDASPPPLRGDQVIDMDKSPPTPVVPEAVYRHDGRSRDRSRRQIPSNRFRSPTSSPLDSRAITSRFEDDEVVEATPSEDEPRHVYKDFLLGVSPHSRNEPKSRIPTAKKLLSTVNAISPRFPPVPIDSDSSESVTQYRPTKKEEKYKFRSLLCKEDITSAQFSADLQELELKLINLPDRDVPFLSISRTLSDRKNAKCSLLRNAFSPNSKFNTPKEVTTKAFAPPFEPGLNQEKPKESPEVAPRPKRAPKPDEDRARSDKRTAENETNVIPKSRNSSSTGMEVTLGSEARNPVTLAGDGAVSALTTKDGS